jgi:hypothetical protein
VNWQSPQYQEVKMDAEIGSYQPDGDTPPDGYLTRPREPHGSDGSNGSRRGLTAASLV